MARRRRLTQRMLLLVNILTANAVAGLWVAAFVQPEVVGADRALLADGSRRLTVSLETPAAWVMLLLCLALLLCNFAYLVRRRDAVIPVNWVSSEGPGGTVRIAREAVEAALRTAGGVAPHGLVWVGASCDISNLFCCLRFRRCA